MPERFAVSRFPSIIFGDGVASEIPQRIAEFGTHALVVTGASSFTGSRHWTVLQEELRMAGISWSHMTVSEEPSPELVDSSVKQFRDDGIEVVIAIGGGSVLDAAKAIAGLLPKGNSVMDYLEGVGPELKYEGPSIPFIAVPTTAGTGSEATKNSVLSVQGEYGFKKSFRHEQLVARYAIVDPQLLATCPRELIAANGMDALTQLIESYVSMNANPMMDALAISGIESVRNGLFDCYGMGENAASGRRHMAYAALMSGITLAQVGLGSVHGLASPLGAYFPIPHGVACGAVLAVATEINIRAMQAREPENPALDKYAHIAGWLSRESYPDTEAALESLVVTLNDWTRRCRLPELSRYGVTRSDIPRITAGSRGSSMKTNPIVLLDSEIDEILVRCI